MASATRWKDTPLTQPSPASSPKPPDQPSQPDQPAQPDIPSQPDGSAPSEPAAPAAVSLDPPDLPEQPAAAVPPPPPPPVPAAAEPPKRRIGLIVTLVAVVVAGLVVVGAVLVVRMLGEEVPTVGDCLTDAPAPDDMEIVDCDSDQAFWSVIGNDGSWTRGEFDTAEQGALCEGFEATERALWVTSSRSVDEGTGGEVVCLAPLDADPADGATDE